MIHEEQIEILETLSDQKKYYGLTLIRDFMTKQCNIMVCDCDSAILGEKMYCVISRHINDDKINIRFGNKKQIENMINSYIIEKEFEL